MAPPSQTDDRTADPPGPSALRPWLPTSPPAPTDPRFPPAEQELARQIAQRRADDPLTGVKVGSDLFYDQLVRRLAENPGGVRPELLLAIPALLAGYACQAATWESLVVTLGYPVDSVFLMAGAEDGAQYPFSDPMNHLLLEDELSVWGLAQTTARELTDEPLPDAAQTVAHVVQTIGTPQFGQPRMPDGHPLGEPALLVLTSCWTRFLPLLGLCCAMPEEWPAVFALGLQRAMARAAGAIDPATACVIALECAVPMAHLPMRPAA
ncbi:MAG: hypothetical protein LBG60_08685 [Bifidobacteriaceae bacterium]|jgi:hypothetical protein|nr:hypothetical protein [Bifidobacteriaceae bacterium]